FPVSFSDPQARLIPATPGLHRLAPCLVGKRGARSAPLCLFMWRTLRAPPVSSPPMGWAGFVLGAPLRTSCAGPEPFGLAGQTVTEARVWGGTGYPPSHATVARPTRHRRPPSIPGPDRGSREGDGTDYAGAVKGV